MASYLSVNVCNIVYQEDIRIGGKIAQQVTIWCAYAILIHIGFLSEESGLFFAHAQEQ